MTIVFKNGKEIKVSQYLITMLAQRIEEGCNQFQMFRDYPNTPVNIVINVQEISLIYDENSDDNN